MSISIHFIPPKFPGNLVYFAEIFFCILKSDFVYNGKVFKTEVMRVALPAQYNVLAFHPSSLFLILSIKNEQLSDQTRLRLGFTKPII